MLLSLLFLFGTAKSVTNCPTNRWSGQCTACPGYWYQTCRGNEYDNGQRGCGFLNAGCETKCTDDDGNGKDYGCGCGKGDGCLHADCEVNEWGPWTPCNKACGTGSQSHTRTVKTQKKGNGKACPALSENRPCNEMACVTQSEPYCLKIVTGKAEANDGFLTVSVNGATAVALKDFDKGTTVIEKCYDKLDDFTVQNTKTDGWYGEVTVTTNSGAPVALICEGCTGKRFSMGIVADGDDNGAQMGDTHCLNKKACKFTPFFGPNCVSIITGGEEANDGGLQVMMGNKVLVPLNEYNKKQVVLQQCFEDNDFGVIGLQNTVTDAWTGSVSITYLGVPSAIRCDGCTGRAFGFGDSKVVVDGNDDGGQQAETQCFNKQRCNFVQMAGAFCLSIVTSGGNLHDGYLSVTVNGSEKVAGNKMHAKNSVVIQECFDGDFELKLQNTNTNAWNGKVEVTQYGEPVPLSCDGCGGEKFSKTIAMDGNSDAAGASGMSKTHCINKKVCTFTPPTPAPTTPMPTVSPTDSPFETPSPVVQTPAPVVQTPTPTVEPGDCAGLTNGLDGKSIKVKKGATKMSMRFTNKKIDPVCECHDLCADKDMDYFSMYYKKDVPKCQCYLGSLKKIKARDNATSGGVSSKGIAAVKNKLESKGRRRRRRGGRGRRRG